MAVFGENMSQLDFMNKDMCITVDDDDNVTGAASKYEVHVFDTKRPQGTLHRAFSVFLFDEKGRLLLQQRAKSKITFPSVWTNTCCSHPLHGFSPTEVDTPADVASGDTPGAKRAAVRKLKHELGLETLKPEQFKFLTRLHYWAADTVTHGPSAEWGEHEIDYILFAQVSAKDLGEVKPNPEEVDACKFVTQSELESMLEDRSLLWSPWFRIIASQLLCGGAHPWWGDLKGAMTSEKFVDKTTIYAFSPPFNHDNTKSDGNGNGGSSSSSSSKRTTKTSAAAAAAAGREGDVGNATAASAEPKLNYEHVGCYRPCTVGSTPAAKQGAYGKLKTHEESKVSQLCKVDEVFTALLFKVSSPLKGQVDPLRFGPQLKEDVEFCDAMLGKVSRSFAAVIRQLPADLVLDCLVFYLVLRALDTVEDDMNAFESVDQKLFFLKDFYEGALHNDKWKMQGVGEGDEALLLENFGKVSKVFQALPKHSREVIDDINKRMGAGMARFVALDLGQGTTSTEEYNLYCHFVAGLVGEGLSRLFVATNYENPMVASDLHTSNCMGLFLQKTNIIRDYLEDYVDGRAWWPQDVWKKHATSGDLGEFSKPESRAQALACLNELVTDALTLIPECLVYLRRLDNDQVFRFCAIPQVMAIATLEKCFNNPDVFTGVVKVRKGLAVKMIVDSKTVAGVEQWFRTFALSIKSKVNPADPSAAATIAACDVCLSLTTDARPLLVRLTPSWVPPLACFALAAAAYTRQGDEDDAPLGQRLTALFNGSMETNQACALAATLVAATFLLLYALSSFRVLKPPSKLKAA